MTRTAPPLDLGFFLPSTCRQCPASGCGPVYDAVEDPHTVRWPGGSRPLTCEYQCGVCGCTWTDTWPPVFLFGPDDDDAERLRHT
ncbi:hypothetical protein ACWFPY_17515 [Nocardia fluminea]